MKINNPLFPIVIVLGILLIVSGVVNAYLYFTAEDNQQKNIVSQEEKIPEEKEVIEGEEEGVLENEEKTINDTETEVIEEKTINIDQLIVECRDIGKEQNIDNIREEKYPTFITSYLYKPYIEGLTTLRKKNNEFSILMTQKKAGKLSREFMQNSLKKLDTGSLGYTATYDFLHSSDTCSSHKDVERCQNTTQLISSIYNNEEIDEEALIFSDYNEIYVYGLMYDTNYIDIFNTLLLGECENYSIQ